jgi:taurine transport system substrate-binding protein
LPLEDATRMMKGTEMIPCDKQLTADYMGTSDAIGKFADTLVATSAFLVAQDRLPKQLTREDYENFLVPSYLEAVVK